MAYGPYGKESRPIFSQAIAAGRLVGELGAEGHQEAPEAAAHVEEADLVRPRLPKRALQDTCRTRKQTKWQVKRNRSSLTSETHWGTDLD